MGLVGIPVYPRIDRLAPGFWWPMGNLSPISVSTLSRTIYVVDSGRWLSARPLSSLSYIPPLPSRGYPHHLHSSPPLHIFAAYHHHGSLRLLCGSARLGFWQFLTEYVSRGPTCSYELLGPVEYPSLRFHIRSRGVFAIFTPRVTTTPVLAEIYNLPAWIIRPLTRPGLSFKSNGFRTTTRIRPFEVHLRPARRSVDEED